MKRVMLVDDSPTIIHAAYDELEDQGYVVEVAYDGKEAIDYLKDNPEDMPDLIVMDIEMPKMRGDEASKVIKANPAWNHIPIVALTSVDPDNVAESLTYFDNYMIKPFGFEQMLSLVQKMIGPAD